MANTGSLIQLHTHSNLELLELLSDVDGNLYYDGKPIYVQISANKNNAIKKLADGIFVDNSILSRLSIKDDKIYFDNELIKSVKISQESGNEIVEKDDGIFSPAFVISPDDNNALVKKSNGYFVQLPSYEDTNYTEKEIKDMIKKIWDELNDNDNPDISYHYNFVTKDNLYIRTANNCIFISK